MKEVVLEAHTGMSIERFSSVINRLERREVFQYAVAVYHPLWHTASFEDKIARVGEAVAMLGADSPESRWQLGAVLYMCCNALSGLQVGSHGKCMVCRSHLPDFEEARVVATPSQIRIRSRGTTLGLEGLTKSLKSQEGISSCVVRNYLLCLRTPCRLTLAFVTGWSTFLKFDGTFCINTDWSILNYSLSRYLPTVLSSIVLTYYDGMARETIPTLIDCQILWPATGALAEIDGDGHASKKRRILPSESAAAAAAAAAAASNS